MRAGRVPAAVFAALTLLLCALPRRKTGEEIPKGVVLAPFWRRGLAFVIDSVLAFISVLVVIALLFSAEDAYLAGFIIGFYWFITIPVVAVVILPLLFVISDSLTGGQTVGKMLLGIAVRNREGERAGITQLVEREVARGLLFVLFFIPALIDHFFAIVQPRNQTWHDLAGDTIVIRE